MANQDQSGKEDYPIDTRDSITTEHTSVKKRKVKSKAATWTKRPRYEGQQHTFNLHQDMKELPCSKSTTAIDLGAGYPTPDHMGDPFERSRAALLRCQWRFAGKPSASSRLTFDEYWNYITKGRVIGYRWRFYGAYYRDSNSNSMNIGHTPLQQIMYESTLNPASKRSPENELRTLYYPHVFLLVIPYRMTVQQWHQGLLQYLDMLLQQREYEAMNKYLDKAYSIYNNLRTLYPERENEWLECIEGLDVYRRELVALGNRPKENKDLPTKYNIKHKPPSFQPTSSTVPLVSDEDLDEMIAILERTKRQTSSNNTSSNSRSSSATPLASTSSSTSTTNSVPECYSAFDISKFWAVPLSALAELVVKGWLWVGQICDFNIYVNVTSVLCLVDSY